MKVKVTMDSGAAGRVMLETLFPHTKLERNAVPKKFAAANGEPIKDVGEKKIPFKPIKGCTGVEHSGALSNLSFQCRRWFEPETLVVVLDEKNPHIRHVRDGSMWT